MLNFSESPKEECGVIGIFAPNEDVARMTFFGLYALQPEDFGYAPFDQRGGLGRVHQLFGVELPKVIDELNRELVA